MMLLCALKGAAAKDGRWDYRVIQKTTVSIDEYRVNMILDPFPPSFPPHYMAFAVDYIY